MVKQSCHRNHRSKRRRRQAGRVIHASILSKSSNSRSVGLSDVWFDYISNNEYSR